MQTVQTVQTVQNKSGKLSKDRIYVCHTFYHVYVTMLKECNLPLEKRGRASLVLSRMSNDFGNLEERARRCGLFEAVYEYDEKEDTCFPELGKYKKNRGNIFLNMLSRIRYCKLLGRLQEPYVPVDFKEYGDIYVFCDSDPIGYYLSWKKIRYHALEDGLNCISSYDTARYDNRGCFRLKALLASWNVIFIQNGYGKYCIDMEVNDISCLPYPCPKYIEQSRQALADNIREEDKELFIKVFLANASDFQNRIEAAQTGGKRMTSAGEAKGNEKRMLLLSEPLCDMTTRKQIFRDIIDEYGKGYQIFIKPHPRDTLDYRKEFPEQIVLEGKFPMEVMNFLPGICWDRVVSVFTMLDAITFAKEKIYLGEDLMDRYEAPELHRQNEGIGLSAAEKKR